MSTSKTPNYQLSQWAKTDPVSMSDFNADNQIIDTALAGLQTAVQAAGDCHIVYGSYTGTGTYKSSNPKILDFADTLGTVPKFLFVSRENGAQYMFLIQGMAYQSCVFSEISSNCTNIIRWNETSVQWSCEYSASTQLNISDIKYYYVAIA